MNRARTVEEMLFAASLEPCPRCGSRQLGTLDTSANGQIWTLCGNCPSCGNPRSFEFTAKRNPQTTRIGRFDLGPLQSELLSPAQFLAVFEEATKRVPENPSTLDAQLRERADEELRRALICVTELFKLLPLGAAAIPGSTDPRLQRTWLSNELKRLRVLAGRYASPSTIDSAALAGHHEWLQRGVKGPGQIKINGGRLARELYGAVDLTFVEISRSDLTAVDFAEGKLERALLEDDVFVFANVRATSFVSATIRGGDWTSINGSNARFSDAEIAGASFARSELEGSLWVDARVRKTRFDGARFGSAVLDRATFEDCSFVDASMAQFTSKPEPTSDGARFVNCDLSSVDWSKRNLRGTTFVRCKLAGATGTPTSTDGLVFQECDLDRDGFLAQLQHPLN